ncbi:MAG: copper amine oxidase N-terminal domain-containing protein [Ruminococcaceae bacterium]|nr:copper amine oxidase N-terminal domain-containing protein [Oscillospiraceae bacterium]
MAGRKIFMKKKIFSLIFVIVMIISSVPSVLAANSNNIEIYVDGVAVQNMDVKPFIENGRTLVPVRAVAEAMGAEVLWNQETQTVSLKKFAQKASYKTIVHNWVKEDGTIEPIYGTGMTNNVNMVAELIIGNNEIKIGLDRVIDYTGGPILSSTAVYSEAREMDVTAVIVDGRTFIPARFVGYALGYDVSWNDELRRVDYKYIERQTIDFDIQENEDNTPILDYEYDKEKYPDITTVYDKDYPSRKGYEDIVIIDTSIGKYENGKMVNLVPYKFIQNNYIIESDEKEYDLSNDKTPEENLETFKKFYEDKVHDEVKVEKYDNGGIGLNPTYSTINDAIYLKYAPYQVLYELYYDQEAINYIGNKKYYGIDVYFTKYDFSKYFMHNTISNDLQYGSKLTNGFGIDAGVHNSLLMSNEFLGETGQRIWKMMNDYYTLEGAFYVNPNTEWTKCQPGTTLMLADPLDPISDKQASEYGLNVVNRFKSYKTTLETLVINSGKQNIYVEYRIPDISSSVPTYSIFFEYIE